MALNGGHRAERSRGGQVRFIQRATACMVEKWVPTGRIVEPRESAKIRKVFDILWQDESGQDAAEYILVVILIALAITAAISALASGVGARLQREPPDTSRGIVNLVGLG